MALEPITRKEKIIAGQDLTPITRMEMFLKQFGGGGGGSVPKPLTYDYMPEGYPKKSVQTTTLMEEQEVAFALGSYDMYQASPTEAVEIAVGQTYTVVWDGTEYICVSHLADAGTIIGNLSFAGIGDDTGEPFVYLYMPDEATGQFATFDTSTRHTIGVKTVEKVIIPMAAEFLPANTKNTTVFYVR